MAACEESPTTPAAALRPAPAPGAVVVVIGGPTARADVPELCERVRAALEGSDADVVVCEVGALVDPDVGTVDALARLALTARRLGRQLRLRHASGELAELLALAGLGDVVGLCAGSLPVEPGRQTEQREQARGVEEGVEPDDPAS